MSKPLITIVWLTVIATGIAGIGAFNAVPGTPANKRLDHVLVHPLVTQPTLFVGIHPKCACSMATLQVLDRLISSSPRPFATQILVWQPLNNSSDWMNTKVVKRCQSIPQSKIVFDLGGQQASRMGISTSGGTVFVGEDGQILFTGGLTDSRLCETESLGERHIRSILDGNLPNLLSTPVYGCSLIASSENSAHRVTKAPEL